MWSNHRKSMNKRIGFACKLSEIHPKKGIVSIPKYNTGTTTVSWLRRQTRAAAEEKLWSLMKQNIESTKCLIEKVGNYDPYLRMVRLSSDILPVYTEPNWRYFWQLSDVRQYAERQFAEVGKVARDKDVRLSFHPGQFTVLASDNPNIVTKSIEEFEYHADMVRWMGYGQLFQDFKINVHIAGRRGPAGIREAYKKLSPEAKNCITIENEENTWGLDECLSLSDIMPIVLDIHHHYIREGEYIEVTDDRVKQVLDSWRGLRPTLHYSQSREDLLDPTLHIKRPIMSLLLGQGFKKQKLRAHSDFMWNQEVNNWAYDFWDCFDVMVEAKAKNLASYKLYEDWMSKGSNPLD